MSETNQKAIAVLNEALDMCRRLENENDQLRKNFETTIKQMNEIRQLERKLLLEPNPN